MVLEQVVPGILLFAFILLAAIIAGRVLSRLFARKPVQSNSSQQSKDDVAGALYSLGLLQPDSQVASTTRSKIFSASKIAPILLGIGLILMPYFENRIVEVIAYFLIVAGALIGLLGGRISLGSKWLWIPLAVLTVSGLIFSDSATGLLLVWLFVVYLVSNKAGSEVTRYFGLATAVACAGLVVYSITHHFNRTGGLFSPGNYNIATAAILTGFLMWNSKYRWLLSPLVVVALFFAGADEAILAIAFLFIVLLIRRDWSKKLLLPVAALALTLAVCTPLGITQKIWGETRLDATVSAFETRSRSPLLAALGNRLEIYQKAFHDLKISGHGYQPFDDMETTIHNIPLRVAYELGIIAGLAWLVAYIYAIKRSKAKYALVAIGVLALVDHMFWTQISAYFWVALGSAGTAASDLIFREAKR